jgi:hypothetical protein
MRPTTDKPFAYVTVTPPPETPAGAGGLEQGDAILSLGAAHHLRDVQAVLLAHMDEPVPVRVVTETGRRVTKTIIPGQWNPEVPASLLGCAMTNQLPAGHPALRLGRSYAPDAAAPPMRAWRSSDGKPETSWASAAPAPCGPSTSCWPRFCLAAAAILHLLILLAILAIPAAIVEAPLRPDPSQLECATGAPPKGRLRLRSLSQAGAHPPSWLTGTHSGVAAPGKAEWREKDAPTGRSNWTGNGERDTGRGGGFSAAVGGAGEPPRRTQAVERRGERLHQVPHQIHFWPPHRSPSSFCSARPHPSPLLPFFFLPRAPAWAPAGRRRAAGTRQCTISAISAAIRCADGLRGWGRCADGFTGWEC